MHHRIRDCRIDHDWSQRDMAKRLNIAQTTYSDYERGKINIPISILKELALLFETSIDYLLELTDNPKPYERPKSK